MRPRGAALLTLFSAPLAASAAIQRQTPARGRCKLLLSQHVRRVACHRGGRPQTCVGESVASVHASTQPAAAAPCSARPLALLPRRSPGRQATRAGPVRSAFRCRAAGDYRFLGRRRVPLVVIKPTFHIEDVQVFRISLHAERQGGRIIDPSSRRTRPDANPQPTCPRGSARISDPMKSPQ